MTLFLKENSSYRNKILWIAPNLNHYKARILSRLCRTTDLKIVVLAGRQMSEQGHKPHIGEKTFEQIDLRATKKNFHYHIATYTTLLKLLLSRKFDAVLMPLEKKHIPVILYLFILKFFFRYDLVSYNHPVVKSKNRSNKKKKKPYTRLLFHLYNKIIFYTEQGCTWAVEQKLLPPTKAYFANNTLDTESIWQNYSFEVNTSTIKTLLFIGRLIPSKRIDLLFHYYRKLKELLPVLQLIIIGDGPESRVVNEAVKADGDIIWRGAVVEEAKITKHMRKAHLVFIPGASGLSIIHAFCYGKPYITRRNCKLHGPELSYLEDGKNGMLLDGNLRDDVSRIINLLNDNSQYIRFCESAYKKAQELSIENWVSQIAHVFVN